MRMYGRCGPTAVAAMGRVKEKPVPMIVVVAAVAVLVVLVVAIEAMMPAGFGTTNLLSRF